MTTTHGGDGWCPRGRYWLISGTAGGVVTTTKRVTGTDAQNQDITLCFLVPPFIETVSPPAQYRMRFLLESKRGLGPWPARIRIRNGAPAGIAAGARALVLSWPSG